MIYVRGNTKLAIRNLRLEGDEILSKKSREIEKIDDKLQVLIDDMIDTMHKFNGVGLAAVQVGILKRVVVIDLYDDNGPVAMINPVILKTKGNHKVDEGCLSFPNKFAKVMRPEEVVAEYTDRDGKRIKVKANDLFAQAICHELDHLDGEVFVNKMIPGTLEYIEPEK
jgi:peptide deformylase